MKFTPG